MKPAYYEKNHEGFEGDHFLADKVKSLIDQFGITWAIETGTYRGATTKRLATMVKTVDTFEVNPENYLISLSECAKIDNIFIGNVSSEKGLKALLSDPDLVRIMGPTLFYLDAHFNSYCPLLDELKVIANYKLKPVIVIHDFQVPGRPDLGFDEYNGQPFTWEWIQESVEKIYGVDGYNIEYNSEATGAKRGVIFLTPKV